MIEIAQHIETLLQENDCVIVPGLGGFVTHYESSRKVEEENLFLPPARTVGFNPQLRMNDGVLAQSFMAAYGLNFANATHRIEQEVKELQRMLHEEGKVELAGIGVLHYSIHETYRFVPSEHAITTPSLYGLGSFRMPALGEKPKPYPLQTSTEIGMTGRRRHRFGVRINRKMVSNVLMLLVVALAGLLLSVPVQNTDVIEENYAILMPEELFTRIEKESLAITPIVTSRSTDEISREETKKETVKQTTAAKETEKKVTAAKETVVPATPTAKADRPAPTRTVVKQAEPETLRETPKAAAPKKAKTEAKTKQTGPRYHIIVASMGTVNDAKTMAERLKKEGYTDAQALIGNGKKRVSIQSFDTQADAYSALNKLRKDKAYEAAWILKQ